MTEREKIAGRIRALRAKTVENGCTEAEAMAAAELLAKLLAQYNMTLDEADLRESPFDKHTEAQEDDWVGARLWVVAYAVSQLTGARTWNEQPGMSPEITFFGFSHEVEVARYMLEICAYAMRGEQSRILDNPRLFTKDRQRRAVRPFIDGMSDRLAQRIIEMKPPVPMGRGLMVLHDQLVVQAMEDAGHKISDGRPGSSRDADEGYRDGVRAADKVALNRGLEAQGESMRLLQ